MVSMGGYYPSDRRDEKLVSMGGYSLNENHKLMKIVGSLGSGYPQMTVSKGGYLPS